jgi:predicted  nucleic acid-binding Zn-ribbon protein
MFKSRLLLSLTAFSVSFCIGLLTARDFGKAVLTGSITVVASLVGVAASEGGSRNALTQRAEELKFHIRALQRRRAEAYEALVMMTAERDQIANSLNSMQTQLRNLQIQSSNLWQQKEELSWNLGASAPSPTANQVYSLQVRIQELEQKEAELNNSLSATLSAKQRAELALKTTQAELNQLQAQLVEQAHRKDDIAKDIAALTAQKQQLEMELLALEPKVKDLERYRAELNQFLVAAEPKRQQVELSSRSLQGAIEQLQVQISSLHGELGQLETQILERRDQKEMLDQELASLKGELKTPGKVAIRQSEVHPSSSNVTLPTIELPVIEPPITDSSEIDSPGTEWLNFLHQLPDPEVKALIAISEHSNPSPVLKQIAEDHLTMPELLIDSINEWAMDTIGDLVIDPSANAPIVAPEYAETVKQLIATLRQ